MVWIVTLVYYLLLLLDTGCTANICIGGTGPTKCFTIEHTQSDVVSWQEAQEECESRDETLATILTPYEGKRIADKLPAESTAWIGLQISHNPHREWHWLHNSGWYTNAVPDSDINTQRLGDLGDCLIINRMGLSSSYCNHNLGVICQLSYQPDDKDCELGTYRVGADWVCITSTKEIWVDAAKFCTSRGGNVLIIDNIETLREVTRLLRNQTSHFWTAGTKIEVTWDEGYIDMNPFTLPWSRSVYINPNLDEASRYSLCIGLTNDGLIYKRCDQKLNYYVCSKPSTEDTTTTSPPVVLTESFNKTSIPLSPEEANSAFTHAESSTSRDLLVASSTALLPNSSNKHSDYNVTAFYDTTTNSLEASYKESELNSTAVHVYVAAASDKNLTKKYEAVLICAYILAALFGIGLILLIVILLIRRKERRSPFYKQVPQSSVKTNGDANTGTMRRQMSKDPAEEWGKVLQENSEPPPVLRVKPDTELDIVHNVPLDPRATLERPLTIPKEYEFVTLQRGTSKKSQGSSSVSSDKLTFTDRQSNRTNSPVPIKIIPPIVPKPKPVYRESGPAGDLSLAEEFPLPPPPEELLFNNNAGPPVPPKPSLKPKPATLPTPTAPLRKKHVPDPIYAQIVKPPRPDPNKPTSPPPLPPSRTATLPRYRSPHTSDASDSGVEAGLYSPQSNHHGRDDIAYLDEVIAQLHST